MVIELRIPAPEQFVEFVTPVFAAFGETAVDQAELDAERLAWEPERSIAVLDGDRWVGATGAFSFDLTLPGGATMPVAGVTLVGVLPTHRRQGILNRLMARQLDDIVDRGEAVAILTASETGIYGRFGYGLATSAAEVHLATDRSAFVAPLDVAGSFHLLPTGEARPAVAAAYDRARRRRAGTVTRPDAFWDRLLTDLPAWRDGASALHCVVHRDDAGEPDGYALYRFRDRWAERLPANAAVCKDLVGASDDVEAALFRFLCDLDLVSEVIGRVRPLDDPLRWRLVEPRRMRTTLLADWLWARVLDVPAALEARTYRVEAGLVLEVVDRFRPVAGGRFRLDGGPAGATCVPTDATTDLTLGASELGALYLGGVAPSTLAAAGRIDEHNPGAVATADLLFPITPLPFNATSF